MKCYELTKKFPKEELYGLTNQLRRAAVSVPTNIAEGYGRNTTTNSVRFLHIAEGSLREVDTHVWIALSLAISINKIVLSSAKKLTSAFAFCCPLLEN